MRGSLLNGIRVRAFLFLSLVIGVGLVIWFERDLWNLEAWVAREGVLRRWQQEYPILLFSIAACLYLVFAWLAIPGAVILTIVSGWLFGFWPTLVMVSFMSTAGATLAMLTTRYLLSDWLRSRWKERLEATELLSQTNSIISLFTLRLVPVVPFFLVNIAMGLTRIPPSTFWWVSQLGMLPGTAAYVYFGSSLPSLKELEVSGLSGAMDSRLIIALVILGVSPWIFQWVLRWLTPTERE